MHNAGDIRLKPAMSNAFRNSFVQSRAQTRGRRKLLTAAEERAADLIADLGLEKNAPLRQLLQQLRDSETAWGREFAEPLAQQRTSYDEGHSTAAQTDSQPETSTTSHSKIR
jgi:hypothetical protein